MIENTKIANGELLIKSMINSLKPAEKKVANYILENVNDVIHLSISKLAEESGVSEATVVKFCQRIGYTGYQQLKINLARSVDGFQKDRENIYDKIEPGDSIGVIRNKIFQIYEQSLDNTKKLLEEMEVKACVDMILKSKRIFLFGYGASSIVALDAEQKFKRINHTVQALLDNHTQKTVASLLNVDDLVIAISDSGRTRELIESLKVVKDTSAQILVITSNLGSPVTEYADRILLTASKETPFRGSALASRMAQLAVIDLLFLGVATEEYDNTINALEKTRKAILPNKI